MPFPVHRIKPCRSKNVKQKKNYRSYKVQLRADFNRSCGYCGDDDSFVGGQRGFHIDHFAPNSLFEHLQTEYTNLVYACPFCNIAKSNDWPSDNPEENIVDGKGYINPCDDSFDAHLRRNEDGQIIAKSKIGQYMHNKLKLYLLRHRLIWAISELRCLITKMQQQGLDQLPEYKTLLEMHFKIIVQLRDEQ